MRKWETGRWKNGEKHKEKRAQNQDKGASPEPGINKKEGEKEMLTIETLKEIGANTEEGLGRCLNN